MRVLAIIISNEGAGISYESLVKQTQPPTQIIIASEKGAIRAINNVLFRVNLSDYDYLLRTGHDVYFPPNWIEKNLALDADYIGTHGDAMFMRPKVLEALGGKFFSNPLDDSYFTYMAILKGFKCKKEVVKHVNTRRMAMTSNPWRFIYEGTAFWQIGYGPMHMVWNAINATVRHRNPKFLARIPPYFYAAVTRKKKWPTSKVIKFR